MSEEYTERSTSNEENGNSELPKQQKESVKPEETHEPRKKIQLNWKMISLIIGLSLMISAAGIYMMWLGVEKKKFHKIFEKVMAIEAEIAPEFMADESEEGNAAECVRDLLVSPAFNMWNEEYEDVDYGSPEAEQQKREIARNILEKYPECINELARLTDFAFLKFNRDLKKGFRMELPELAPIRSLFRYGRALMIVLAKEKRYDDYVETACAMGHFFDIYKEPILISQLVKMAVGQILLKGIEDSIYYIDDPAVCGQILDLLKDWNEEESLIRSLKGELVMSGQIGKLKPSEIFGYLRSIGSSIPSSKLNDKLGGLAAPYIYLELSNLYQSYFTIIDHFMKPFPDNISGLKPVFDYHKKFGRMITLMIIPVFERSCKEFLRNKNRRILFRVLIRVHIYYLKNGKLPEKLEDIEYYKTNGVSKDCFYKHPIQYKKSDSPLYFRIKHYNEENKLSTEWLDPAADKETGEYTHEPFGFQSKDKEYIEGVDYYNLPFKE